MQLCGLISYWSAYTVLCCCRSPHNTMCSASTGRGLLGAVHLGHGPPFLLPRQTTSSQLPGMHGWPSCCMQVMGWIEQCAYISASRLRAPHVLTAAMDSVAFTRATHVGNILYLTAQARGLVCVPSHVLNC